MKRFYLLSLIILSSIPLQAQTNYVVNTANSYTPGLYNTLVGPFAGNAYMTGRSNVAVGNVAGIRNNAGSFNIFVGEGAGERNDSGSYNSFIGSNTGTNNTTGNYNTYTGYFVGTNAASGSYNTFYGAAAGNYNQTGSNNVYVGYQAGINITNGLSNVVVGIKAGYGLDSGPGLGPRSTGNNNVLIGDSAAYHHNASGNVIIGSKAGYTNQTGTQNTFLGYQSGYNSSASANTFFGYQAGKNVTSGSNNVIIGPTSGTAITDGNDNVLMGYNTQASDGLNNATAIGSGARVSISNALVLGNGVNVGIGTSTPTTRLEIVGQVANQSGLRLTRLTTKSQATHATDEFLTVNERGDVVKAHYRLRINNVDQWSDKVFSPSYHLRPLSEVAAFVDQQRHLPGIPSAEHIQQEGINLVNMNSLLLEKVEELTLYIIQLEKTNKQQQEHILQQQNRLEKVEKIIQQIVRTK